MTNRIIKTGMVFGVSCIVLVALIYAALRILYPPDKLREIVSAQLNEQVGRSVTFGDAGFSILRGFALDVSDLRIAEAVDFDNEYFLSTGHFVLQVKLLPLLSGKIEIKKLSFIEPEIYYSVSADGRANIDGLIPADSAAGTVPESSSPLPFALLVSGASISDGTLHYRDDRTPVSITVSPVSMDLGFSLNRDMSSAEITGKISIGGARAQTPETLKPIAERLIVDAVYSASANLNTGAVDFTRLTLETPGVRWECSGSLQDFREEPVRFALAWDAEIEDVRELLRLAPPGYEDIVRLINFSGAVGVTGKVSGNSDFEPLPEYSASAVLEKGEARITAFPRTIEDITLRASAAGSRLEIQTLDMKIGDDPFSMAASAELSGDMPFQAQVKTKLSLHDIPRMVPAFSAWKTGGSVDADVVLKGDAGNPAGLSVTGSAVGSDISMESPEYPKPVELSKTSVQFDGKKLKAAGGLRAGESSLTFEGTGEGFASLLAAGGDEGVPLPVWSASIRSTLLREEDFVIPVEEGSEAAGGAAEPAEPLVFPPSKGRAVIGIREFISSDGLTVENLEMNVLVDKNIITIDKMDGTLYGGSLTGSGKIQLSEKGAPEFDISMDMENVNAGPALSPFTSFGRFVSGTMSTSVTAQGAGSAYDDIMKNLRSTGKMQIREGMIAGWPILTNLAKWSKIASWESIPFVDWHGAFYIEDERFHSNELVLNTSHGQWIVAGSMGLDYTMDLRANIAMKREFAEKYRSVLPGGVLDFLSDKGGAVPLGLKISGSPSQPKFGWDTSVIRDNVTKNVTRRVGDELNKLTGGILGGKGGAKPDSAADSTDVKVTPEKVLDGLKKLFKK